MCLFSLVPTTLDMFEGESDTLRAETSSAFPRCLQATTQPPALFYVTKFYSCFPLELACSTFCWLQFGSNAPSLVAMSLVSPSFLLVIGQKSTYIPHSAPVYVFSACSHTVILCLRQGCSHLPLAMHLEMMQTVSSDEEIGKGLMLITGQQNSICIAGG